MNKPVNGAINGTAVTQGLEMARYHWKWRGINGQVGMLPSASLCAVDTRHTFNG